MYSDLLPIGSVVSLKEGTKKYMICGRIHAEANDTRIYDYSACFFPEGLIDPSQIFLFDRDAVDAVFFIGCQDQDELEYKNTVLSRIKELVIEDGEIRATLKDS